MKEIKHDRLDELYRKAATVDDKMFSEMRSNVLLYSGDHYTKKGAKFWHRIRTSKHLDEQTKLKLTKNHIENICDKIAAKILLFAPDALCTPNNPKEMQDQKTAELNNSVLDFQKREMKMRSRIRRFCSSFVQIGECHAKVFWNDKKGELIGYEPVMHSDEAFEKHGYDSYDEEGYAYDEKGLMITDKAKPVFRGKLEVEEVLGFNMLRDPDCEEMDESPYYIVRKMVNKSFVKNILKSQGRMEECKKIDDDEETFQVFDGDKAAYSRDDSDNVMLREHYYRPCENYPNGYYYIAMRDMILTQGELPFGIWPFVSAGYKKVKTSARYRSPIKTMRPYQIEINRTASEIATTQVTLGQDKVILNHGSKISHGGKVAGVRAITVTGGNDYKVVQGRDGSQFFPHMKDQTQELYSVMNVEEGDPIKDGQLDAYALLYVANKNREKFSEQGETFEEFVIELYELILKMSRLYLDDDMVIPMIGKSEIVNIAEFKHSEPFRYRVKVEPISDDANSMLGKQLTIQHLMQYLGNEMGDADKGMLIKQLPFLNSDEMASDLTRDYDNFVNDCLAIERDEEPMFNQYDNHVYLINKAAARMREPDFRFLPENQQMMYQQYIQLHEQMEQQNIEAAQRLKEGMIPVGGPLVTVDYYKTTTNSEGEVTTKRAKMFQRSLEWLEQQLEAQNMSMEKMEQMNQGALAEIANSMPPQGMPVGEPQY